MKNFLNLRVSEIERFQKIFRDKNKLYERNLKNGEATLMGEIEGLEEISVKNDLIILLSDRITIMTSEFGSR